MHQTKLIILTLLISWIKFGRCVELKFDTEALQKIDKPDRIIFELSHDPQLRGIQDVWNKIKDSIVNAWNFVKDLASQTKQKIIDWIENLKKRADEMIKNFKEKLENIKEKIYDVIEKVFGNSEVVKACIEGEKQVIKDSFKQLLSETTVCISHGLGSLNFINSNEHDVNETRFLRDLEDKFKLCQESDNFEECLHKVRIDVFDDVQNIEVKVLSKKTKARGIVDNLLETITTCSVEGLGEASSIITKETLIIAKCILNNSTEPRLLF